MIFCDLSTPKDDGTFSVYDDIHAKLLELGIPENEIAFIHNAKSEVQKKDLFGKVRSGQVRIILTAFRTSCTHAFRNPHEQFF